MIEGKLITMLQLYIVWGDEAQRRADHTEVLDLNTSACGPTAPLDSSSCVVELRNKHQADNGSLTRRTHYFFTRSGRPDFPRGFLNEDFLDPQEAWLQSSEISADSDGSPLL
jgi:hypothetical protein